MWINPSPTPITNDLWAQAREASNVERDVARQSPPPDIPEYSVHLAETPQPAPTEWQLYIDQRVKKFIF